MINIDCKVEHAVYPLPLKLPLISYVKFYQL